MLAAARAVVRGEGLPRHDDPRRRVRRRRRPRIGPPLLRHQGRPLRRRAARSPSTRARSSPRSSPRAPDGAGERLLRTFLSVWDDPEIQPGAGRAGPLAGGSTTARAWCATGSSRSWSARCSRRPGPRPPRGAGPARRQPDDRPDRRALRRRPPAARADARRGRRRPRRPDAPALPHRRPALARRPCRRAECRGMWLYHRWPRVAWPPTFGWFTPEMWLDHRSAGVDGAPTRGTIQHMMKNVVEVRDLVVVRGSREVLPGISLDVAAGVTGLLGPSGCGKTTLMRCLVGAQQVRSGTVEVLGEPAGSAPLRTRVGYVTQAASVYDDLTVVENLRFFARVLGVDPAQADEAIASVDLASHRDQVVSRLSGGSAAGSASPSRCSAARPARPRRADRRARPGAAPRPVGAVPPDRRRGRGRPRLEPRDGRGRAVPPAAAHAGGPDHRRRLARRDPRAHRCRRHRAGASSTSWRRGRR